MRHGYSPWPHLTRWAAALTLSTALITTLGATGTWLAERHATGSNLTAWHDCVWWALVTLCTVGYGEHFPVTLAGRVIAAGLMLIGIAIIGTVAALVALAISHRFAQRLEAAMEQVGTSALATPSRGTATMVYPGLGTATATSREITVPVPDDAGAASVVWLLTQLGWQPVPGGAGLVWTDDRRQVRLILPEQQTIDPAAAG